MSTRVLLLNADHTPIKTLSWQRAVVLAVSERVHVVLGDETRMVRSEHLELPWPSVVALRRWVQVHTRPALTRRNVLARDGFRCTYCGATEDQLGHLDPSQRLTMDHVVPRCRATHGFVVVPWSEVPVPASSWLNLVTACGPCNTRKGARLPEEAGLMLRRPPHRPTRHELIAPILDRNAPPAWRPWLHRAA